MAIDVHRFTDVERFLDLAGPFLAAREAEHNLLLGITTSVRETPELYAADPPSYHCLTDAAGTVVAATVRTPPHNVVISTVDDPSAVDALVAALADDPLPGVLAPSDVATRFVAGWTARTGQPATQELAEWIYRLERVIPPERPAPGTWRLAEPRDRERIAGWLIAFQEEATPEAPPLTSPLDTADRWIAGIGRTLGIWEDGGEAVCLVGAGGATPNGIRIGPVYTPPGARGRGYASSLTAAMSQDHLDRGRRFCFLFADLANPTSNKIYAAIGYEPVIRVDQYHFSSI